LPMLAALVIEEMEDDHAHGNHDSDK
jgi:hypothetical protein